LGNCEQGEVEFGMTFELFGVELIDEIALNWNSSSTDNTAK
jgi:hypothetical protein